MKKLSNTNPVDTRRMSYVRSIYVLCLRGRLILKKALLIKKALTLEKKFPQKGYIDDSCLVEPQIFLMNLSTKTFS